jgi:N-acetylglucosaminyldiphosphoundecaprenol N-acetyl-beta-D-mannosaminyltransferase
VDNIKVANILGLRIDIIPLNSLLNFIYKTIHEVGKARLVYVNIHAINLAQDFLWFRNFINASEIVYCDGFGVKWGARFLGIHTPERLSPPDWICQLAEGCVRQSFSIYLLGAEVGVAEKFANILKQKFQGLRIVGTQHGYFDQSLSSAENEAVLQSIEAVKPDIILVGLGMPRQERWLMENWDRLYVKIALPVGALFDYMAGEIPRSPSWMTDHGLEWFGRLITEPRRLWRRYLLGIPRFLWLILAQRLGLVKTN